MNKKPKQRKAANTDDLISIADAARLRGVSHSAMRGLMDRGRLHVQTIAGRRFLLRNDVLSFEPERGGRGRKAGTVR